MALCCQLLLCRSTTVVLPQIKNKMIHRRLFQSINLIEKISQLLWHEIQKMNELKTKLQFLAAERRYSSLPFKLSWK